MKILSIQEAYSRKFARQRRIAQLEYGASGHCVHIGRLSPGCYRCFVPDRFSMNITAGAECNLNCLYCTTDRKIKFDYQKFFQQLKLKVLRESALPGYSLRSLSISGGGEPLLYMERIHSYLKFFHSIERYSKDKPWYYVYTNGILADDNALSRLRDWGLNEIRFHLGASNFSPRAYANLRRATRYLETVSVETPAWPLHRKKIFKMLPIIQDIGAKHLNIGEIELNDANYKRINRALPKAQVYHCYESHLCDGGLVYDVIEEVLRKRYSYSVLDCSCFVKSLQRSPAKFVCHQPIEGLCAKGVAAE